MFVQETKNYKAFDFRLKLMETHENFVLGPLQDLIAIFAGKQIPG